MTHTHKILRVFPKRTAFTPDDPLVFIGKPPPEEMIPEHDEVHISCLFSWDKATGEQLAHGWASATEKPVKLGGPAFGSPSEDFTRGLYVHNQIVFTTRGCNNNCPWCLVPKLEGKLKELPICQGKIIQDNNFLQASRPHKEKVYAMLRTQKGVCFKGGLECGLIDSDFCDSLQSLYYTRGTKKQSRIAELWLACDNDAALPGFIAAVEKLKRIGFTQQHIHCYALIGDDMDANEQRLRAIYNAGAMPRAMLYQPPDTMKKTAYGGDWRKFQAMWFRPAAIKAHMKHGTDFRDYDI